MPVIVRKGLPCARELRQEGQLVFEGEGTADLNIGVLNLMPEKQTAERQFARRLGRDDLLVSLRFLTMKSHISHTEDPDHLDRFYTIADRESLLSLDGLIITGAPVEKIPFDEVDYWQELVSVLEIVKQEGIANMLVCWAAQAALHHHYGVEKTDFPKKSFGVYKQHILNRNSGLLHGISRSLITPVSRYTTIEYSQLFHLTGIKVLAGSVNTGPALLEDEYSRTTYMFNHLEYESDTLNHEYQRDLAKGLDYGKPVDWSHAKVRMGRNDTPWRYQGSRFFYNWLDQIRQDKTVKRSHKGSNVEASLLRKLVA